MNPPIRAGIVGLGRIADLHAAAYLHDDRAHIVAICDSDPSRLRRRASEWGVARTYTDFQAMIDDPDIDAVEIVTPHDLHRDMCVAACRAGKHVSVQKPMALNISECNQMIAAARKANVTLRVFENAVFYPPVVKAKALLQDGAVGEPLAIRFKLGGAGHGGWTVPLKSWLWRLNRQTCGGGPTIFDDGYHKFSVAMDLLGPVDTVHAWIDRSYGVIDAPAMISFRFMNRRTTGIIEATLSPHMTVRSRHYAVEDRVEIVGTEGVLWVTRCTGRLLSDPPLLLFRHGEIRGFEDIRAEWEWSFLDATRNFFQCLLEGAPPRLSGEQGREVTRFAIAAIQSAERGRPISVADVR